MKLNISTQKEAYKKLCAADHSIPFFFQHWWLDAVAGQDNWKVILAYNGYTIVGALPYSLTKKWGFEVITQPPLTQVLGPWLRIPDTTYNKFMAYEKDILGALADALPSFSWYSQNWHSSRTNWLPFYWRGYKQTTRYTYRIQNISDEDNLWNRLSPNIRSDIKKAKKRFGISVEESDDINELLSVVRSTFHRQEKKIPYDEKLVARLDAACKKHNCRKIFIAKDSAGRVYAGVYVVWDAFMAYYLMGGVNSAVRGSGANSLCLWEAVCRSAGYAKHFDLEGSMLETVERFFRGFGGQQTPYFRITKSASKFHQLLELLKN